MPSSTTEQQASARLIVMTSIFALAWYASFLFSGDYVDHPVAYLLLCVAEMIGMVELLGLWLTMLVGVEPQQNPAIAEISDALKNVNPARVPADLVSILIPVAGEPLAIIRETVDAARRVDVPHRTIVLDDGDSDAVLALTQELGVEYLRRSEKKQRKAGNINHALSKVQTDFVAILDSDYVPTRDFLLKTLPFLLGDSKLAFVQAPQYYGNRDGFVSGGTAEIQEIFYRHVQGAKNAFNAAFCVGTSVVFRRAALDEIGGLYGASNSEDIWTSLLLHERGWKSHFIPEVLAVGRAPEVVGDFLKQQFRWARGGMEILFKRNPLITSLTFDQKWQYLHTVMHYLSGIAVTIFFIMPLLYAYLGWRPLSMDEPFLWVSRFVPYYGMVLFSAIYLLGRVPKWSTFVIALGAFPAHVMALFSVLTGFNLRWSVTGVIKRQSDYVTAVAPQLIILTLSVAAMPLVVFRTEQWLVSVCILVWLIFNSAILASFCAHAFPRFLRASALHRVEIFPESVS
jgi:cellulose synthase (UDP-forming)